MNSAKLTLYESYFQVKHLKRTIHTYAVPIGSERMSAKWAKKLSVQCGIDSNVLRSMLEELSSSCGGDTEISMQIIEELTTSCGFDEKELRKFIREVANNCPIDTKKLQKEVMAAHGQKDMAYQAVYKSSLLR